MGLKIKAKAEIPKLERSSVEAYFGIVIGIVIAAVPMHWELKAAAFALIGILLTDICWRSPWTYQWSPRSKMALVIISWILVVAIAWQPIGDQYVDDQKPTEAKFSISIDSIDIFDKHGKGGDVVFYYLWVTLKNDGAPSVVKNWQLTVSVPTVGPLHGHYLHLGPADKWPVAQGIVLTGSDEEDQSENRDVYGAIYPRLLFAVQGLPFLKAAAADTLLTLIVSDKNGNMYETQRTVGSLNLYVLEVRQPDAICFQSC